MDTQDKNIGPRRLSVRNQAVVDDKSHQHIIDPPNSKTGTKQHSDYLVDVTESGLNQKDTILGHVRSYAQLNEGIQYLVKQLNQEASKQQSLQEDERKENEPKADEFFQQNASHKSQPERNTSLKDSMSTWGKELQSPEFTCPVGKQGYFSDPADCRAYYFCRNGMATSHLCPSVLRWKTTGQGKGHCDLAVLTPCVENSDAIMTVTDEASTLSPTRTRHLKELSVNSLRFNSSDFKSENAERNEMLLPREVNNGSKSTDQSRSHRQERLKDKVKDAIPSFFPSIGDSGVIANATPGRKERADTSHITSSAEPGRDSVSCRIGSYGFYPDPSNCARFSLCVNGSRFSYRCPSGMHWSLEKSSCDSISEEKCTEIYSNHRDSMNGKLSQEGESYDADTFYSGDVEIRLMDESIFGDRLEELGSGEPGDVT